MTDQNILVQPTDVSTKSLGKKKNFGFTIFFFFSQLLRRILGAGVHVCVCVSRVSLHEQKNTSAHQLFRGFFFSRDTSLTTDSFFFFCSAIFFFLFYLDSFVCV